MMPAAAPDRFGVSSADKGNRRLEIPVPPILITLRKPRTRRIIGEARRLGLRNVQIERSANSSPRLAAEFNGEPIIVSLALMLADTGDPAQPLHQFHKQLRVALPGDISDVEFTYSRSRPPIASSRPFSCIAHVPQARGAYQAGVYEALGEAVRTLRGRDVDGTEIAFDGFGP